jgi:hypothetical protein
MVIVKSNAGEVSRSGLLIDTRPLAGNGTAAAFEQSGVIVEVSGPTRGVGPAPGSVTDAFEFEYAALLHAVDFQLWQLVGLVMKALPLASLPYSFSFMRSRR